MATWAHGQGRNRPIAPATVNRSIIEPLRKLFIRARVVWRYSFPREPLWRNHRLREPTERVRELLAGEQRLSTARCARTTSHGNEFASATGLRLAETLIGWDCVNWEARTIVTTGKGGRTVRTPLTEAVAAILEPLKGHHPEAVFTYFEADAPAAGAGAIRSRTRAGRPNGRPEKRAGVKGFRFHDLRHIRARLLRETGNLETVQGLDLGDHDNGALRPRRGL